MLKHTGYRVVLASWSALIAGCTIGGSGDDTTSALTAPLYFEDDVSAWYENGMLVPVCWTGESGFDNEKTLSEAAIQASWGTVTGLTFTFTPQCPTSGSDKYLKIQIHSGSDSGTHVNANSSVGMGKTLRLPSQGASVHYHIDPPPDSPSTTRIKYTAVHEMGHSLGFHHEQDRPENDDASLCPGDGRTPDQVDWINTQYGDLELGAFDQQSIMSYCGPKNEKLTKYDVAGAQAVYLFPGGWSKPGRNFCRTSSEHLFVGKFDTDSRVDLLCDNYSNGSLWVDLANSSGAFTGSNWSMASRNYCRTADERLLIGDADGDGRDDLICNNISNGSIFVDLAGTDGSFTGSDWSKAGRNFCQGSSNKLYVGDFDGDSHADVLCNESNGTMSIDYGNSTGQFNSTDWTKTGRNFCRTADERLYVGDADGDGSDDLICNNIANGVLWVDLSDAGQFNGSNWHATRNYCNGPGDELHVTDINGDGRADLLCWNQDSGFMQAMLAGPSGHYDDVDWQGPFAAWCAGSDKSLYTGDFNGDGWDDLLCLSTDGTLSAQYSALPLTK